jgi:hypothetical protein
MILDFPPISLDRVEGEPQLGSCRFRALWREKTLPNQASHCDIQLLTRPNMQSSDQPPRVLCVACSPRALDILDRALRYSQWRILTAATRKKGIAVCVAEKIALAVLDAESIRGNEASVATSLKKVRPNLRVIMLEERQRASELPVSVDAIVPLNDPEMLLKTIQDLLRAGGTDSVSAAS